MIDITDCESYAAGGKCIHQAAPRRLFGCADCIFSYPPNDLRIKQTCTLQVKRPRPPPPRSQVAPSKGI